MKKPLGTPNFDYLGDMPYQKQPANVQKYNQMEKISIPGVRDIDKARINKSDFRPVTKSERGTKV
jgi:hypothetical protein